jgi:hypothetical protein
MAGFRKNGDKLGRRNWRTAYSHQTRVNYISTSMDRQFCCADNFFFLFLFMVDLKILFCTFPLLPAEVELRQDAGFEQATAG